MKRVQEIIGVRAMAIAGIVFAHIFFVLPNWGGVGYYLATTFNTVFFFISALLFGLQWGENNNKPIKLISFFKKRVMRLALSLYPLLIIMFVVFYIIHEPFSIKDVLMNFMFLSWFDKLTGFGHLWFVTMIIFCYLLFVVLSRMIRLKGKLFFLIPSCIILIILQCIVQEHYLPGYLFLILLYCGIAFFYARNIIEWIDTKLNMFYFIPFYILFNAFIIWAFYNGLRDFSRIYSDWLTTICGFSQFVFLYMLFKRFKVSKLLVFISTISYEIYLVHHPFCLGKFSLFNYIESPFLGIIAIWGLSLFLAYLLYKLSEYLKIKLNVR